MTAGDVAGLAFSYAYSVALAYGIQCVGQRRGWSEFAIRKAGHIGAGLWVWGILSLFDHWYFGVIPFALPILSNAPLALSTRLRVANTRGSALQTIYFSLSITILLSLLWRPEGPVDRVPIAVAAIMSMTLGDGFAGLLGRRYGRRKYAIGDRYRTWEGTTVMAVVSSVAILFCLRVLPGSSLAPFALSLTGAELLAVGMIGTGVATAAEGLSPSEADNLTVPVLAGLAMFLTTGILDSW